MEQIKPYLENQVSVLKEISAKLDRIIDLLDTKPVTMVAIKAERHVDIEEINDSLQRNLMIRYKEI